MSDFILDYDILETIAKNSNTISKKANEYADSLTSKVANAINGVSPSSGYLSDASYYVNAKVDQLQQKSREFSDFANKINNLAEMAKRVDEEVAELLAQSKERFLNYHESLRIDDWKARILEWLVDIKNSLPILELIGNVLSSIETILESLADNIKHWYHCEGGKYIFDYIASVALAVVAIALFIGTLPASGFFAICGAIGAGIAALNAVTNIATSWRAVNAAQNGDPAWANIYGKQDKLSDVLRQTNFNDGFLNNLSYFGANTLDATETFCDIAGFAEIGVGIAGWAGKNKGNIKNTLIDLKDSVKKSFSDFKVGGKDNVFGIVDDVDGNVIDNLDISTNKDVPIIGGVDVPNKPTGDIPKVNADDVFTKGDSGTIKGGLDTEYSTIIDDKVSIVDKEDIGTLADTFTDGVYRTVETTEDITVYRVFGGNADAGGAFATTSRAQSRIQTKNDSALLPEWKNSMKYEAEIVIPKGTKLNIGTVEQQITMSGTVLKGGADQILLPQGWDLSWIKSFRNVSVSGR